MSPSVPSNYDAKGGLGRVRHYVGDALSVIKTLPENSVDLVATSPP